MKYYICICSLIILLLTGCGHNKTSEIQTDTKPQTTSPQSLFTWWLFSDNFNIDWLRWPIIISWENLIFENIFSITISKEIKNRRYEKTIPANYINQNLSFWNDDGSKSVYINELDTQILKQSIDDKDVCLLQTTYNWSLTFDKNTIQKKINDYNIFITQITFFTEWNIPPYDYTYITHFCFIKNNIMYDLVFDNYKFSQANKNINTFNFLD